MLSLIKLSRSLPDAVVLLQRGFQIDTGSASLSIFHRIGRRNFAQQLRRLQVERKGRRLQLLQLQRRRKRVLLCRSSRNQQSQIDDKNPRECAASPLSQSGED